VLGTLLRKEINVGPRKKLCDGNAQGRHQVVRFLNACLWTLACGQHHCACEKVSEVLNPLQVDARSANTVQRAVLAYAPRFAVGKRSRFAQGVRRGGRRDDKGGFLWSCLLRALREDELPCRWRDRAQFDSAALTDKERVVLGDGDWAVIGQGSDVDCPRFDALDTRLDFDVASHMMCVPHARDDRQATESLSVLVFCLGGFFPPAGPNARGEPRPTAAATQERRLLGVGSTALLGMG